MNTKKNDAKLLPSARLSQAARTLGGAVRATLPTAAAEETWRDKKSNGKKNYPR